MAFHTPHAKHKVGSFVTGGDLLDPTAPVEICPSRLSGNRSNVSWARNSTFVGCLVFFVPEFPYFPYRLLFYFPYMLIQMIFSFESIHPPTI